MSRETFSEREHAYSEQNDSLRVLMALRPHRKQRIIIKQYMTPLVPTPVVGRMTDSRGASEMTPVGQKTAGLSNQCK